MCKDDDHSDVHVYTTELPIRLSIRSEPMAATDFTQEFVYACIIVEGDPDGPFEVLRIARAALESSGGREGPVFAAFFECAQLSLEAFVRDWLTEAGLSEEIVAKASVVTKPKPRKGEH